MATGDTVRKPNQGVAYVDKSAEHSHPNASAYVSAGYPVVTGPSSAPPLKITADSPTPSGKVIYVK